MYNKIQYYLGISDVILITFLISELKSLVLHDIYTIFVIYIQVSLCTTNILLRYEYINDSYEDILKFGMIHNNISLFSSIITLYYINYKYLYIFILIAFFNTVNYAIYYTIYHTLNQWSSLLYL